MAGRKGGVSHIIGAQLVTQGKQQGQGEEEGCTGQGERTTRKNSTAQMWKH